MNQMSFPCIKEDILASVVRRKEMQCSHLIRDINADILSPMGVIERIKEIEKGLRKAIVFD